MAMASTQGDPAPSDEGLNLFGDERDKTLSAAVGFVIAHEREGVRKALAERDRRIAMLKKELRTLSEDIESDRAEAIEVYCSGLERRVAILEADNIRLKALLDVDLKPRRKRNV